MRIQSRSRCDTVNICYSKLWVIWVQPQYLSVVISDIRTTFISWYIRLLNQALQAEADQKLPFRPLTEFETGQIDRLTLTFLHLWCSMLPPRPSAARVFYNIRRYNRTIDNLVHMKAECNEALQTEFNPAEYLKMHQGMGESGPRSRLAHIFDHPVDTIYWPS